MTREWGWAVYDTRGQSGFIGVSHEKRDDITPVTLTENARWTFARLMQIPLSVTFCKTLRLGQLHIANLL